MLALVLLAAGGAAAERRRVVLERLETRPLPLGWERLARDDMSVARPLMTSLTFALKQRNVELLEVREAPAAQPPLGSGMPLTPHSGACATSPTLPRPSSASS